MNNADERLISIFRARLRPVKLESQTEPPKPYILVFLLWWLPALGTLIGAGWTAMTYLDGKAKEEEARVLQARTPYLNKRLDLFFEASKVTGVLAAYSENIHDDEWKKAELRFWALRWSELEVVGNPVVRDRMRSLQSSIIDLKSSPMDREKQHAVRWMVECVANELRRSLDSDWPNPITEVQVKDEDRRRAQPSGCGQFRDDPARPTIFR